MLLKTPKFWNKNSIFSNALTPLSWVYTSLSSWKQKRARSVSVKVSVPVICVGNLVMGGAGKTPTVIAIVDILKKMGHTPHILSRGYGAIIKDFVRVNPDKHSYLQVGDEPLLLAQIAHTWAGSNRVKSAKAAIAAGATVLVMDDGLQNYNLHKDFNILVIDAMQGFGNCQIFPAGPLREPIKNGIKKANAVVVVGENSQAIELFHKKENISNKVRLDALEYIDQQEYFRAILQCEGKVEPKSVVAFAGLGYPEKFRHTLEKNGYIIKDFIPFADHHPYTIPEIQKLLKIASHHESLLITTSKDHLRVPYGYRNKIDVLPVQLTFNNPLQMQHLLKQCMEKIR